MKVYWTETAESHLEAIFSYISSDSPQYAKQIIDKITRRSQQISFFPLSGRKVPEYDNENIREIFEGSYRLIYYIKSSQIDVLAVIHSHRNIDNSNP